MTTNRRVSRRSARRAAMALVAPLLGAVSGCGLFFGTPFVPGRYEGEFHCVFSVTDQSGSTEQEPMDIPIVFEVAEADRFIINGDEIERGASVVRSIATADLAFEVTAVVHAGGWLTVTYAPRPTLPGIAVEGELVETYHQVSESIAASARANLDITDVSGVTTLEADCLGTLPVTESP